MKQLQLAGSVIISASLYSCIAFSQASLKDVDTATPHNWSGVYVGLNAGVVKNTMNMTDVQATTFNATIEQASNPDFLGGFQFGLRRQLDPLKSSGVYGLEFSANFSNASSTNEYGSPFALYHLNSDNQLKANYLLQLTGGIAADRTLLFLAAGCSWTDLSGRVVTLDGIPFFHSFSVSKTSVGTALGGGIEYAYNEHFSLRFKADLISAKSYNTRDDTGSIYQIANRTVQGVFGVNYTFS